MYDLTVLKGQFPKRRFWELFSPNVTTFSLWMATASFSFFAYDSLESATLEGIMSGAANVLAWGFLYFGFFCVIVVGYLIVTWLLSWRITRREKTELETLKDSQKAMALELDKMENRIKEIEDAAVL